MTLIKVTIKTIRKRKTRAYTHTQIKNNCPPFHCQWTSACTASIGANPPHATASVDLWDRQTDRWMDS